jgi:AraC-like DNA-binding protein
VHFLRAVLRHAVHAGIDPLPLLRRQRIPPRLLREAQARISVQQFADLQTQTMRAMHDESLGYAPRRIPLGSWDMMCHAVITAGTLGDALHRYCRFFQLFEDRLPITLSVDSDAAVVRLSPRTTERGPYLAELALLNTHRFACWLVQEELPLRAVRFAAPPSTAAAEYRLMFLANPVAFEAGETALELAAGLLDRPVLQTPESLQRYLRHPTRIMLTQVYNRSWTARVRTLLHRDLRHMPELPQVATQLELHPQTLRRRLAAEGTTFKQLKSDIRRDTALHCLGKRTLSVEDVAYRAGFSEASAFIRAFKSWTGVTPYAYRKGL